MGRLPHYQCGYFPIDTKSHILYTESNNEKAELSGLKHLTALDQLTGGNAMNELVAGTILTLMFILRFAIPFILLLGLAYILNRIQAGWQTENSVM
jgi:hypothetical protein